MAAWRVQPVAQRPFADAHCRMRHPARSGWHRARVAGERRCSAVHLASRTDCVQANPPKQGYRFWSAGRQGSFRRRREPRPIQCAVNDRSHSSEDSLMARKQGGSEAHVAGGHRACSQGCPGQTMGAVRPLGGQSRTDRRRGGPPGHGVGALGDRGLGRGRDCGPGDRRQRRPAQQNERQLWRGWKRRVQQNG